MVCLGSAKKFCHAQSPSNNMLPAYPSTFHVYLCCVLPGKGRQKRGHSKVPGLKTGLRIDKTKSKKDLVLSRYGYGRGDCVGELSLLEINQQ